MMNVLVCIKRVPSTGARITLTEDEQSIETRNLGFTIGPHEECAVEEAIQLAEKLGGATTVLTLGPEASTEQLRDAMAMGIDRAMLLNTDDADWDPMATASAMVAAIQEDQAENGPYDVILMGNEAADTGGYQVGIRVAYALNLPCVAGIKELEIVDGRAIARREAAAGWEQFEVPLPAVFTVKEGINLPRYPSLPGKLRAKKKPIDVSQPTRGPGGPRKVRLKTPLEQASDVEILGQGAEAVPKIIALLREIGVV